MRGISPKRDDPRDPGARVYAKFKPSVLALKPTLPLVRAEHRQIATHPPNDCKMESRSTAQGPELLSKGRLGNAAPQREQPAGRAGRNCSSVPEADIKRGIGALRFVQGANLKVGKATISGCITDL